MSTYRMSDGTIVKTENATQSWEEGTYWNGSNRISVATGTQWNHETLYRSRKGRYYKASTNTAEWVSNEEAARWLLHNGRDVPKELSGLVEQISE